MTDADALHLYATRADPAALAHLVAAHADLVYAAALRQVVDPGLAADVAQAVFILLTRRSGRIRPEHLAGWLVRAAHFASKDAVKRRRRREHHEERAMTLRPERVEPDNSFAEEWLELRPHLDAALARLRPAERTAIALQDAYAIREFKYYSFGPISQLPAEDESPARLAEAWRVTDFVQPLRGLFYPRTVASQQFSLRINQPPLLIHRSQTTVTSWACNLAPPPRDIFHANGPDPIVTSGSR
ncbi:MAG TPA: sigma-70 family RNA polymerase sigma factor [Phycisphaerae bacterium]|nr:sigma-70 family RNA polymerase sigma factor [Phycisphaerae bacterium]